MNRFEYVAPATLEQAVALLSEAGKRAKPLAGGMDLLGEMKDHLVEPERLVNLKAIPHLDAIDYDPQRGLRLGATATLTRVANHPAIRQRFTAIAQAAQSVGTPQIRNQGTVGGNLCQRPRCWYYRNPDIPCLKKGGEVCYAVMGENKYHALFGGNPDYIVHPSDLAPALIALNARVTLVGPQGRRTLPLEEFFILPAVDPSRENVLAPQELVAEVEVPAPPGEVRSAYSKFQERETSDFALSSAAVALTLQGEVCQQARIVLGGVATIPWPVPHAAALLIGQRIDAALAAQAAEAALQGAEPMGQNAYKIPLTKTMVKRAILEAVGD